MLSITFDIRSEMAGPVVVPLEGAPPFSLVQVTDLIGTPATNGKIAADFVLVRLLGDNLMLSLRDLKELRVEADVYSGSLTLLDGDGQEVQVPVQATCKTTLWYR